MFINTNNHKICLSQVLVLNTVTLQFVDGNISLNQYYQETGRQPPQGLHDNSFKLEHFKMDI